MPLIQHKTNKQKNPLPLLTFPSVALCFLYCSSFGMIPLTCKQGWDSSITAVFANTDHNFWWREIAALPLHPIYKAYLVSVWGVPLLCSLEAGSGKVGEMKTGDRELQLFLLLALQMLFLFAWKQTRHVDGLWADLITFILFELVTKQSAGRITRIQWHVTHIVSLLTCWLQRKKSYSSCSLTQLAFQSCLF